MSDISIDCVMVCIYLVCLPFTIVLTPFGSVLKVITMPLIAVLMYKLLFGECKKLQLNSVHLSYTLYMLCCVWSLLYRNTPKVMVLTKDMFLAYATVMMMTIRVYNEKEKNMIEAAWLVLDVFCIYLGIFSTEQRVAGLSREFVVIGGYYEDVNQFCTYFLMPLIICLKRIASKSPLTPFYAGLVILSLYAIMRGGSRGGMIAIVIEIVIYIFIGIKDIHKKIVVLIAGVLCAVVVMTVVFPNLPEDVRARYSIESVAADGASGRFDIWAGLIKYTCEKPERIIHGDGVMSTEETIKLTHSHDLAKGAHNQFIQVFADQGIIGLIFYLFWMATCFFRNVKKRPEYACAFTGLMGLAFSLSFYSFKPLTNIVIMCALTFENDREREKELQKGDVKVGIK